MFREILSRGIFYWLRAPRNYADFSREQGIMAGARLFLSLCLLTTFIFDKNSSSGVASPQLILYSVYSLLVCLAIRLRVQSSPFFHIGIHCADILWAVVLTLATDLPGISLVLLFFLFISSKMHWGFWETQFTGVSFGFLSLTGVWIFQGGIGKPSATLLVRVVEFLLYCVIAFLLGCMAEVKAQQHEKNANAALIDSIRIDQGLQSGFQTICDAMITLFQATQVLIAVHTNEGDRTVVFRATNARQAIDSDLIAPEQWSQYFFPVPAQSWRLETVRQSGPPRFWCTILESGKIHSGRTDCGVPDAFLSGHPLRRLLGVALQLDDGISVRAYVIDPLPWFGGSAGLRFLNRAANRFVPMMLNLMQADRVQNKAEAAAHQKVARELHDGAIQSLSSISLQIDQLWRCAGPALAKEAVRVATIQKNIRDEIAALREFMIRLRSTDLDSSRLLPHLAQLAVRFQFDTNIATRFVSEVEEVQLRPNVCMEVAKIAQEALVNVRKHSGADEVLMRFSCRNGDYVLQVADNGHGFGFTGRRSYDELVSSGNWPAVIMERAKEIRARVEIESEPGSGSSLEISIPINPQTEA